MYFLIFLLASLLLTAVGGMLVWLMQLVRYTTPNSDVRALSLGIRLLGIFTLAAYGIPAAAFSIYGMSRATQVGFDKALEESRELIGLVTVAGMIAGTIGISLIVVSLSLTRVQTESRSLKNNPFVLLLLGVGVVLLIVNGVSLSMGTMLAGVLVGVVIWRYLCSRAEERRAQVLWTLTLAAEGRRSLSEELRDGSHGFGALFATRVNHVADLLESGYSLSAALETVPGLVPASALLMIRVGEEAGDLPRALREATLNFTRGAQLRMSTDQNGSVQIVLFSVVLFFSLIITQFLMIWIVPKYKKIFEGFDTELPQMTKWLIQTSDFIVNYFAVMVPPGAIFLGVLGYLTLMFLAAIDPSRVIEWQLWGYLRPRIATGTLLRCLSIVIGAGRPLPGSLATLADNFPCKPLRQKLKAVAEDVNRGQNVWQSLLRERLLRNEEVELIFAADRAGNLPWALEELANGVERRLVFRIRAVFEFIQPAVIVAAGLLVMLINVSFFLPLVKLIEDLS